MGRLAVEKVKECIEKCGGITVDIALNIWGETIKQEGEAAFAEALEIGIANTIAAMYDANNQDESIINALNKYWGITYEEAEQRLLFEKSQSTIRELERYMKLQGFTEKDIRLFFKENKVASQVRHNRELWELRRKPDKLMQRVKEKN